MNSKENFIIDKPYSLQPEDEHAISNVLNKGLLFVRGQTKNLTHLRKTCVIIFIKNKMDFVLSVE